MGASIGYWQGDVQKLTEDIAALKPAIFLGVPRVFDRIYSKVMAQVGGGACSSAAARACVLSLAGCVSGLSHLAAIYSIFVGSSECVERVGRPLVCFCTHGESRRHWCSARPRLWGRSPSSCVSVRLAVQPTDGRTFAC